MRYKLFTEFEDFEYDDLAEAIAACDKLHAQGKQFRLWDYGEFFPAFVADYLTYQYA